MPPNSAKIPDAEIELIRKWIEGGALETSGSHGGGEGQAEVRVQARPVGAGQAGGPAGDAREPRRPSRSSPQARPSAVVAMAASPWAPLVAVGGHKQVLLYRTTDNHLVGVLPFPEGTIHVLRFSRNGDLLLVGGGRGGQSGLAVAFDVKTGQRVFEVGKEYDAVLAADISPDHGQVALGGPSKVVRVYNTADGNADVRDEEAHRVDHGRRVQPRRRPARDRRPQQRPDRLGGPDRPRVLRPPGPHRGDHRHLLAARFERRRLVERGRLDPALGDGERRQHQDHRRPRRRRRVGPVRQGRPARLHRPRPGRPGLGPERQQAARVRSLRRPGPRGRLQPRRVEGDRRRLVGRGPGLGRQGRQAPGQPRRQPRPDRRPARTDAEGLRRRAGRGRFAVQAARPAPGGRGARRRGPGEGPAGVHRRGAGRGQAGRRRGPARPGPEGQGRRPRPKPTATAEAAEQIAAQAQAAQAAAEKADRRDRPRPRRPRSTRLLPPGRRPRRPWPRRPPTTRPSPRPPPP